MELAVVAIDGAGQQRPQSDWHMVTSLVLDAISSRHTRRAYSQSLDEFLIWFRDDPARVFNKATVQRYRTELDVKGLSPSSINVRLCAIRRLALEAADNGLLDPEMAAGISRTRGVKRSGVRIGHWLTAVQAHQLLSAPNLSTIKGIRDSAVLALLLGAGLRRSELAALNLSHIQEREGRWLIVDLIGKCRRIRSIPIPMFAYDALTRWTHAAGITDGALFRCINRHSQVQASRISPQAVFEIVKSYTWTLGFEIAPHDLRRSFARLAYVGKARLEQIQLSLGHASVVTTEIYLGVKQDLRDAPCDHLGLRPETEVNKAD